MKRRRPDPARSATPANWAGSVGARKESRSRIDRSAVLLVAGFALVIGGVAGFAFGADRDLRHGLLAQRAEMMAMPDWVALDTIPTRVTMVFLAVTDPTFERRGRIVGTDDDKTIGRDLVRQVYRLRPTPAERAREFIYAPVLESRLDKRQLLELYLNRVLFGVDGDWRIYGIGDAAREYFGKSPARMTLSEAATLAGLLLPPRIRLPDEVPGAVGARRNEVLRDLLARELIDRETYEEAIRETLPFQPGLRVQPMAPPPPEDEPEVIRLSPPPLDLPSE